MEFKSIDLLSITECCEYLNIVKEDLPDALSRNSDGVSNLSEIDRSVVIRLSSLIEADKDAFEHCSNIKHYQEYLTSSLDGLYREKANTEIYKIKKNRKIKFLVVLLISMLTIIALVCVDNYYPASKLDVSEETITLNKRGETKSIKIKTDAVDANIFFSKDYNRWLSVERAGDRLSLTAEANYSGVQTTTVTIESYSSFFGYRYNRMAKKITVKQESGLANYLRTNISEINFDKWGTSSQNKIIVETDGCDIQVSQNGSWFAFTKEYTSQGSTTIATLTLTAVTNNGKQQSGDLTISSNQHTQKIKVFQESGLATRFDLKSYSLTMAEAGSGEGLIYPIDVYTDGTSWSVKSAPDWLKACADMGDKRLEISVGANNGDIKTGTITLESNNGHLRNITVAQEGDPTIFYADRSSIHFGTDANSRTIYITNNSHKELQVVEDMSWITTSLNGNKLIVSCSKNKNNPPQYGVVHVKCGNKDISISVKQDGWEKCRECGGDHKVSCTNDAEAKWNQYTETLSKHAYEYHNGQWGHWLIVYDYRDFKIQPKTYHYPCKQCGGSGEIPCTNSKCKGGLVKKTAQ